MGALLLTSFSAFAEEVRLDYKRGNTPGRPAGVRPGHGAPPAELRLEVEDRVHEVRRELDRQRDGVARAAGEAAARTAQWMAEERGRTQAWQLGFYDGLRVALDDPRLGRWDYRDGLERGRRDFDARRRGADLGTAAAEDAAERVAEGEVAAQYHDLSREPARRPSAPAPPFDVDLRPAPEPRLEDVFHDLHLSSVLGRLDTSPLPDPWRLYRHGSHRDVYDARWWDDDYAFSTWKDRHRSEWRALDDDERRLFEDVFRSRYRREIGRSYEDLAERAYDHGFDQGWDYGAAVSWEWNYRRGFHEGWHDAFARSAHDAYDHGFDRFYEERYDVFFDDWSRHPKPEVSDVTVWDASGDGVFAPGEEVLVDYEVTNYGGAPGGLEVRLDGRVLDGGASAWVDLPRRRAVRSSEPLQARVDPGVRPQTVDELAFTAGVLERRLPFKVSYPLELDRGVRLVAHDSVAGRAVVEVGVRNASRRAVAGEVELVGAGRRDVGVLAAGEERRVDFELVGLEPLALLAGEVETELAVTSGGRLHDSLRHRLPELATDLREPDLLLYLGALARRPGAASHEVRRAQELVLRRLEVDWQTVEARGGNAYKDDLQNGTATTALGELVAAARAERWTRREVWTALVPRIEELSKTFPGTHPFLRKSMRKLARQIEG